MLGRCAFELEPVFETVLQQAVRLCRADAGLIYVLDGDVYRVEVDARRLAGVPRLHHRRAARRPGRAGWSAASGPSAARSRSKTPPRTRATRCRARCELGGFRTMLGVPMLAEERVLGVIVLWREDDRAVRRPHDRRWSTSFATQGVIAIQNVQTARALEIASGHKSEFLASMSHELRTPLNAVIGFSDVLLERMFGELNERQEEYVRDIRDSGRHLLELINEILDLSKVEAGRMELEPRLLSLPDAAGAGAGAGARAGGAAAADGDAGRRRGGGRGVGGRDQAQAGRREPAHQRGQVHAGRAGRWRSTRGASGDGGGRDRARHRRRDRARRTRSGSSRPSSAATGAARPRAPGSGSRSPSASSSCTAGGSGWRARSARAARSGSRSRWGRA